MTADDDAAFLASSTERWRLLDRLRDGPGDPATLADELSLSRRTVQRHLAAFAERDWARKTEGAYHLTSTGALAARTHADYLDALAEVDALSAFYDHVANLDSVPGPAWLADATLETATREHPQAPVRFYVDRVRAIDTDRVRMVSPVLSRIYHDAHADLAKAGAHTELVLPAPAVARARDENPIEFTAILALGVLDLYRTTEPVDLGVTIAGDVVLACAYDDDGHLAACLESRDQRVRDWAVDRFERHREAAERVTPPGSGAFDRST